MKFSGITKFIGDMSIKVIKSDFIQNYIRDLKSLRSLWNWIIGILYVWMCIYSVLYYESAVGTVVTVTGGLMSVIFTNYVWSSYLEKKNGNGNTTGQVIKNQPLPGPTKIDEREKSGDA